MLLHADDMAWASDLCLDESGKDLTDHAIMNKLGDLYKLMLASDALKESL